jgi:hypothetical protein
VASGIFLNFFNFFNFFKFFYIYFFFQIFLNFFIYIFFFQIFFQLVRSETLRNYDYWKISKWFVLKHCDVAKIEFQGTRRKRFVLCGCDRARRKKRFVRFSLGKIARAEYKPATCPAFSTSTRPGQVRTRVCVARAREHADVAHVQGPPTVGGRSHFAEACACTPGEACSGEGQAGGCVTTRVCGCGQ